MKPTIIRLDSEDRAALEKIAETTGGSLNEAIRKLIRIYRSAEMGDDEVAAVAERTKEVVPSGRAKFGAGRPEDWPYPEQVKQWQTLILPVGNVIGKRYMTIWPLNTAHHDTIAGMFKPWFDNGFALVWGDRETGRCTGASRRMQPYFFGDRHVWAEIVDPIQALAYLKLNSQVIVPLVIGDLAEYGMSEEYREAYDLYESYYLFYFFNKRPKTEED